MQLAGLPRLPLLGAGRQSSPGGSLIAIGRHSIMNGVSVRVDAPEGQRAKAVRAAVGLSDEWQSLVAWRKAEVTKLASLAGLGGPAVPYTKWLEHMPVSLEASRDAHVRYRGVDPACVGATFPPLPKAAEPDSQPPWTPADVGQPSLGGAVHIPSSTSEHSVIILAKPEPWFVGTCLAPSCRWAMHSMAFPAVHSHGKRHENSNGSPRGDTDPPKGHLGPPDGTGSPPSPPPWTGSTSTTG